MKTTSGTRSRSTARLLAARFAAYVRASLLARRDFRLMWLASTVTSFGGQITLLALPLTAVMMLDATPSQMGILVALEALPFSLLSLHAGVVVDRMRRLPIMLVCEATICLTLLVVPLAATFGVLSMPLMYVTGFVLGTTFVFVGSAAQVYLTQLAGRDRLIEANSLFIASESAATLTGPGIAGLLIQGLTAPIAIVLDCIGFVCSLVLLGRIRHAEPAPVRTAKPSATREIREGLALVLGHPILRPLTMVSSSWFVIYQGWIALQTLYATRDLGLSAGQLGAAHMMGGAGALLSAFVARHIARRFGAGVPILLGVLCPAFAWLLLAVLPAGPHAFGALGLAFFVFDFGVMLYWINYASVRQAVTPDPMLGRMTATMRFFTVAPGPLGAIAAGRAAEEFGVRPTFAAMGLLLIAVVALLYACTSLRSIPDVSTMTQSPPASPNDGSPSLAPTGR